MLGISKRVDEARDAFLKRDTATAAKLHDPQTIAERLRADESQKPSMFGMYIGDMVYGGLDGIITTFAVVSGVAGAQLSAHIILILGIANLLADGFSMGTGDYLSTKSEREYYDREMHRQRWEIEHLPEGQKVELKALYMQNGYSQDEAEQMVALQTRYRDRWVNAMMIEELHMLKDDTNPLYNAFATFIAFVVAGSLPLVIYLIGLVVPVEPSRAFTISIALSAVALFGLGAAKVFVTRLNAFRSGLEMLLVGGFAALVAYVIGALLKNIGG